MVFRGQRDVRDPQRRIVARKAHARGQHAHHGVTHAINAHRLPQNLRTAAEAVLPQAVAQNHHRRRARRIFPIHKIAADHRLQSQQAHGVGGNARRFHALGLLAIGKVHRGIARRAHELQHLILRAIIFKDWRRHRPNPRPKAGVRTVDVHQPVRLAIRQRIQHHGIDHAENRGIRADTQGQRHNGRGRIPGILAQHAQRVLQVLPETVHRLFSRACSLQAARRRAASAKMVAHQIGRGPICRSRRVWGWA